MGLAHTVGDAFNANALMAAAEAQTGLSDWGEEDIRRPLEILCYSLNEEAQLHEAGRRMVQARLSGTLVSRLQLMADRKRYPDIAQQPIVRPVIVLGLPRSGTTNLHGLLASHPGTRSPRIWEMAIPSPPPRKDGYETDPRIGIVGDAMASDGFLTDELRAIHPFHHNKPEECGAMLEHTGYGSMYTAMCKLPTFTTWRENVDFRPAFRYHRKFLQHLQSANAGCWWVLKSAEYHFHLEELFAVYPDACVVCTHRDPGRTVPSVVSLFRAMKKLTTQPEAIDPIGEARSILRSYAMAMDRIVDFRARSRHNEQIVDVQYADVLRDPYTVVRRIYEHFQLPLTQVALDAMAAYLADSRQNRHGAHQYSLADCGLSERDIERYYTRYIDHYQVTREART